MLHATVWHFHWAAHLQDLPLGDDSGAILLPRLVAPVNQKHLSIAVSFRAKHDWKKNMSERLHASRNAIFISSSALQRTNIDKEKLAFVDPFPNGQSMGFWYIHHFTPDFHGTCLVWGPLATSCCRHSGQQPFWESVGWAPIGTASGFITSITGIHHWDSSAKNTIPSGNEIWLAGKSAIEVYSWGNQRTKWACLPAMHVWCPEGHSYY